MRSRAYNGETALRSIPLQSLPTAAPREQRCFLALIALLAHFSPGNRATFVETFSLDPPREWTGGAYGA
jgi:hypothetical protein